MSRVEIVGPVGLLRSALTSIQEEGVLHIEEIPLSDYGEKQFLHRVPLDEPERNERDTLFELVELLEEALRTLPESDRSRQKISEEYRTAYRKWLESDVGALAVASRSLHSKVRSFVRRRRNVADDLEALAAYEEIVETLAPLVESNELPPDYDFIGVMFEPKADVSKELFRRELRELTNGEFKFYEAPQGRRRVSVLVGYAERHAHAVTHFVLDSGISQMNVPRYLRDKPFEQALAELQEDLASLNENRHAIEKQEREFYAQRGAELAALLDVCRDRGERFRVMSSIATTRYAFIVRGWVPRDRRESFQEALSAVSDGTIFVHDLEDGTSEKPPVVLKNPKAVSPFEPLLRLFPLPRYGTVDPTGFVATLFPPMFGLMLADIGYGIFVAIGAGLLFLAGKKKKILRNIAFVAAACAFFTVVFGIVYGEFFGEIGHRLFGLKPLWRERFSFGEGDRTGALLAYMAIAGGIGVFHILLGLILGVINSRKTGDKAMIVENLAKIAGIFVLLVFVGRLVRLLPPVFTTVGISALVVFIVLMLYQILHRPTHGLLLPLEVLGTVGNILSYIRIMAIGLVSVVLAYLANLFGGMISNVVLGVIVAVLVHALNLALGILDPTIQGLRLQYVEFFSKFFLGGGTPYTPFRRTGGAL